MEINSGERNLRYPDVDADVPYEDFKYENGLVARYRRTIARRTNAIGGTAGYKYGVDFHIEVHCSQCCCHGVGDQVCGAPAGGFVVMGARSGELIPVESRVEQLGLLHLMDPIRHPPRTSIAAATP